MWVLAEAVRDRAALLWAMLALHAHLGAALGRWRELGVICVIEPGWEKNKNQKILEQNKLRFALSFPAVSFGNN